MESRVVFCVDGCKSVLGLKINQVRCLVFILSFSPLPFLSSSLLPTFHFPFFPPPNFGTSFVVLLLLLPTSSSPPLLFRLYNLKVILLRTLRYCYFFAMKLFLVFADLRENYKFLGEIRDFLHFVIG